MNLVVTTSIALTGVWDGRLRNWFRFMMDYRRRRSGLRIEDCAILGSPDPVSVVICNLHDIG